MKPEYEKPATDVREQIELLRKREVIISNVPFATDCLNRISYYRLKAYRNQFDEMRSKVADGTTFEKILSLYSFDDKLRRLVLEATDQVEITVRCLWANHMALAYGPFCYEQRNHFHNSDFHSEDVGVLNKSYKRRSGDAYFGRYRKEYSGLPPIWMAVELMTFGQLSKWIGNLKHRKDVKMIANAFGVTDIFIRSFLRHVAYVRNICAHNDRLWNRDLTVKMEIPKISPELCNMMNKDRARKIHNTLVMLVHCMSKMESDTTWSQRLVKLIDTNSNIARPVDMGFPTDWRNRKPWKLGK